MVTLPVHPAYTSTSLPSHGTRQWLASPGLGESADKAALQIFNLAKEAEPPVRLVLSNTAIGAVKAQAQSLLDTADKYASRSANLGFD